MITDVIFDYDDTLVRTCWDDQTGVAIEEPLPGAMVCLGTASLTYRVHLISYNPTAFDRLCAMGVGSRFVSHHAGNCGKTGLIPKSAIAEQDLHLTLSHCVLFDDRIENVLQFANAGGHAVHVRSNMWDAWKQFLSGDCYRQNVWGYDFPEE